MSHNSASPAHKKTNRKRETMSSELNTIMIAFNNQGVAQLRVGDYRNAMMCFKEALDALGRMVKEPGATPSTISHSQRSSSSFKWSRNAERHSINSSQNKKAGGGPASFVFERAVILDPSQHLLQEQEGPPRQQQYCVDEFAALMYNLALTNQIYALRSGPSVSTRHFKKARSLYDMAFSILKVAESERHERQHSPHYVPNINSLLLEVAILNNMGQIQQELGLYEEAKDTFQTLLTEWLSLEREEVQQIVGTTECNGLFLNLFMYANSSNAAPAA